MATKERVLLALLRISLGCIFLWAFFDKLFGLGFSTKPDKTWLLGVSPTLGFLSHSTGPFASFYQSLAGNALIDWLFMLGLLLIGLSLLLGIGIHIAGHTGALLMLLMYTAAFPPANNPLLDEHVIYFFTLLLLAHTNAGTTIGLGKFWQRLSLIKRHSFLA